MQDCSHSSTWSACFNQFYIVATISGGIRPRIFSFSFVIEHILVKSTVVVKHGQTVKILLLLSRGKSFLCVKHNEQCILNCVAALYCLIFLISCNMNAVFPLLPSNNRIALKRKVCKRSLQIDSTKLSINSVILYLPCCSDI